MAFQTVEWVSSSLLPCAGCLPSKVILCLPEDYVVSEACPLAAGTDPQETNTSAYKVQTIKAELLAVQKFKSPCNGVFYRYSFVYEGSLIESGKTVTAGAIQGVVCDGCLTQYVDDRVGNEIKVELIQVEGEADKYKITSQHGCEYLLPVVPEHTSIVKMVNPGTSLTLLGKTAGQTLVTLTEVIENPSDYRPLNVIVIGKLALDFIPTANELAYAVGAGIQLKVPAMPLVIDTAEVKYQSVEFPEAVGPNFQFPMSTSIGFTIPPGGSETVQLVVSAAVLTTNMILADAVAPRLTIFGATSHEVTP